MISSGRLPKAEVPGGLGGNGGFSSDRGSGDGDSEGDDDSEDGRGEVVGVGDAIATRSQIERLFVSAPVEAICGKAAGLTGFQDCQGRGALQSIVMHRTAFEAIDK